MDKTAILQWLAEEIAKRAEVREGLGERDPKQSQLNYEIDAFALIRKKLAAL